MAGLRVGFLLEGPRSKAPILRWIPVVPNLRHGVWSPHCWQINLPKLLFPSHLPLLQNLRALGLSPAELHKLFRSILGDSCALWRLRYYPPAWALGDFHILIPAHPLLPDAF